MNERDQFHKQVTTFLKEEDQGVIAAQNPHHFLAGCDMADSFIAADEEYQFGFKSIGVKSRVLIACFNAIDIITKEGQFSEATSIQKQAMLIGAFSTTSVRLQLTPEEFLENHS
jgi:hypothetical protein